MPTASLESFRTETLKALGSDYQNALLKTQDAPVIVKTMRQYRCRHPKFIHPPVQNAELSNLLADSAAQEAAKALHETTDLLKGIIITSSELNQAEARLFKQVLTSVHRAAIPPTGTPDIPKRAARLESALKQITQPPDDSTDPGARLE